MILRRYSPGLADDVVRVTDAGYARSVLIFREMCCRNVAMSVPSDVVRVGLFPPAGPSRAAVFAGCDFADCSSCACMRVSSSMCVYIYGARRYAAQRTKKIDLPQTRRSPPGSSPFRVHAPYRGDTVTAGGAPFLSLRR